MPMLSPLKGHLFPPLIMTSLPSPHAPVITFIRSSLSSPYYGLFTITSCFCYHLYQVTAFPYHGLFIITTCSCYRLYQVTSFLSLSLPLYHHIMPLLSPVSFHLFPLLMASLSSPHAPVITSHITHKRATHAIIAWPIKWGDDCDNVACG